MQTAGYTFELATGSDSIALDGPDRASINVAALVSAAFSVPITTAANTLVLDGGGTAYFSGTDTLAGA